jgi:hypothetical protein
VAQAARTVIGMPYLVKWIARGSQQAVKDAISFEVLAEAMDHGCSVLDEDPADLWIEDEQGLCVAEIPKILEHCAKRRLQQR